MSTKKAKALGSPKVVVVNHQETIPIRKEFVRSVVENSLPLCLSKRGPGHAGLPLLKKIVIALLDDAEIGRVHQQFFNDPTPTDVITFPYGEILLGVETIARNAQENECTFEEEVSRCLIHALLHLQGFDDLSAGGYKQMHQVQEQTLAEVRKRLKIF